jgi:hypothetical protein
MTSPRPHPPEVGPALACGSYHRGHTVHWIQARKASEDQTGREPGRVVETGDGWLVVSFRDGRRALYGHHDVPRLERLVQAHGDHVIVQDRWGILRLGSHLISISREPDS